MNQHAATFLAPKWLIQARLGHDHYMRASIEMGFSDDRALKTLGEVSCVAASSRESCYAVALKKLSSGEVAR